MPARPGRQRLVSGFCTSAHELPSTLPPDGRSPFRPCASVRSLWPGPGRTCTSKSAPVPGAHEKAPRRRGEGLVTIRCPVALVKRAAVRKFLRPKVCGNACGGVSVVAQVRFCCLEVDIELAETIACRGERDGPKIELPAVCDSAHSLVKSGADPACSCPTLVNRNGIVAAVAEQLLARTPWSNETSDLLHPKLR